MNKQYVSKIGLIVVVPTYHEVSMGKGDHDYPYMFFTYYIDLKIQCIRRVGD
jgi:hypothetical protein